MESKQKILIRNYKGNESESTSAYKVDLVKMQTQGYVPVSQNYTPGSYGCGQFIFALLLCLVIIGIIVFIYMLIVKPSGVLTVTYELRETSIDKKNTIISPRVQDLFKAAITLHEQENYSEAIKLLEEAIMLQPNLNVSHFNLACLYSITTNFSEAYFHLQKAVELGYDNFEVILTNNALTNLRNDSNFKRFSMNGYKS